MASCVLSIPKLKKQPRKIKRFLMAVLPLPYGTAIIVIIAEHLVLAQHIIDTYTIHHTNVFSYFTRTAINTSKSTCAVINYHLPH